MGAERSFSGCVALARSKSDAILMLEILHVNYSEFEYFGDRRDPNDRKRSAYESASKMLCAWLGDVVST